MKAYRSIKTQSMLILAAGLLAGNAGAATVRLTAEGTINSSNMGAFSIGQSITMSIEYETVGSPQTIQFFQAFYVDHITSISFSSGDWNTSETGSFGQINKYDNLGNTDGISFQIASLQSDYQYTNPKPQTVSLDGINGSVFRGANIIFSSFSSGLWDNYDLPESYDFSAFDQAQSAGFGFNNGTFGVGWNTLQSEIVPAPGTLGLIGLGGIVAMRRRR